MFLLGSPFFYMSLVFAAVLIAVIKFRKNSATLKTVSVNIFILLLLFSAFDSTAIVYSDVHEFRIDHYYYHHGLKPLISTETRWGSNYENLYPFKTNSLSFIDFEPKKVSLKKNGKRFILIGDSFVEGVGYSYGEAFAGMVTKYLAKKNIEVLNPAAISYSPKLHYLKLKYFIDQGLEVDEIFQFIDISDIIDEVYYDYFNPSEIKGIAKFLRPADILFTHNSFVYRKLKKRYAEQVNPRGFEYWGGEDNFYGYKGKWTYNEKAYENFGKEGIELAKKHVDKLWKLCKDNGIKLHIIAYPWHETLLTKTGHIPRKLWEEYANERGISFIQMFDLFEAIPENEIDNYYIPKDIHWNDNGHRIVGEFMIDFFRDYIKE
jgi:hypothetical protein